MIEAASDASLLNPEYVDTLRPLASFNSIAFSFDQGAGPSAESLVDVLALVRERLVALGDPVVLSMHDWTVFEGYPVSNGPVGTLESGAAALDQAQLLDVVDGLVEMLEQRLPADPVEGWWGVGFAGGRTVVPSNDYREAQRKGSQES